MPNTVPTDPNLVPISDDSLLVPMGVYEGITCINKFGRNTAIASGATEELWDGSAAYSYPTTAVITHVSQTLNQAAMTGKTIEVQGLDANWVAVTQTVALDGTNTTTAVELGTPLIRIFRMKVLANVVTDQDIRAHNAAENQDYAIITAGANQTLMAIYTVPVGKSAFVTNFFANEHPISGNTATSLNVSLWARDNKNGYEKQIKHSAGMAPAGHFQHNYRPYSGPFGERTDIFLTLTTVGGASDMSGGFDLILVDD